MARELAFCVKFFIEEGPQPDFEVEKYDEDTYLVYSPLYNCVALTSAEKEDETGRLWEVRIWNMESSNDDFLTIKLAFYIMLADGVPYDAAQLITRFTAIGYPT